MIIGVAGHIDHGKSTLVTALTGVPMDRLAEERQRGITIELGFAPLDLGTGEPVGVVDVPGHEDFVRTMVAGASGVDLLLLVVDAQEGIRPQTLEHLAVAEQLGIAVGVPVITKADLADPDWLDLVRAELSERLARSIIQFGAPAVVSAVTGLGLPALKERLAALAQSLPPRPRADDLLRLPIDRVFALRGVGTVVTGTLWSGTLRVGDTVRIEPGAKTARVRSLETFGRAVANALPGSRTALGLQGVDHDELRRGQVVIAPSPLWPLTRAFDGVLTVLPVAPRPLASRARVRLHHGTAEVMARVYLRQPVLPGQASPARLVLEAPLLLRGGDRFVMRSYSPVTTIGGGWVADPIPPRRRDRRQTSALWNPEPRLRLRALVERREQGVPVDQLGFLTGARPQDAITWIHEARDLVELEGRVVTADDLEAARGELLAAVKRFHEAEPARRGISLETLRSCLRRRAWMADAIIRRLVGSGALEIRGGLAAVAGFEPRAAGGEAEVERVVETLTAAGLTPPTIAELTASLGLRDGSGALRIAADRGLIEAVERDRYYATAVLAQFAQTVREVGQGGAAIQPAVLRDRTGLSRKYLIPLLEWCDRAGVTFRDATGNRRLTDR